MTGRLCGLVAALVLGVPSSAYPCTAGPCDGDATGRSQPAASQPRPVADGCAECPDKSPCAAPDERTGKTPRPRKAGLPDHGAPPHDEHHPCDCPANCPAPCGTGKPPCTAGTATLATLGLSLAGTPREHAQTLIPNPATDDIFHPPRA